MKKNILFSKVMLLCIGFLFSSCGGKDAGEDNNSEEEQPLNIVLIFTDDQGYQDLGVFGAEGYTTPHLDQMAAEGTQFTNFHVAHAVCSASRASLLTGCYANRLGIYGALSHESNHGLDPEEVTIAEMLQPLGTKQGFSVNGIWATMIHSCLPNRGLMSFTEFLIPMICGLIILKGPISIHLYHFMKTKRSLIPWRTRAF